MVAIDDIVGLRRADASRCNRQTAGRARHPGEGATAAKRAAANRSPATVRTARATPCSTIAAYAPISSTTRLIGIPTKQGKYLLGTHIPIFSLEKIAETRLDYALILPWTSKTSQLNYIRNWGARFVVPIPEVAVI
jgi:hypothetical protein